MSKHLSVPVISTKMLDLIETFLMQIIIKLDRWATLQTEVND